MRKETQSAGAASAGRKARCPACGAIVIMTASVAGRILPMAATAKSSIMPRKAPAAVSRRVAVPAHDDGFDALQELANQANSAPMQPEAPRCPQCSSEMDDGAALCVSCGYNTRTGKALSTASVAPSKSSAIAGKKGKQPVDLMAPQGSFILGLAMSAIFALLASIIWIVVAWLTGFAIGYIAILIGGAAGAGMKIGQKGFSHAGGYAAAGMTLCAILLAKLAVIEMLLSRQGFNRSIFDLNGAKLGYYFLSPIGLIIMVIGMGAAYRTANGSVTN